MYVCVCVSVCVSKVNEDLILLFSSGLRLIIMCGSKI